MIVADYIDPDLAAGADIEIDEYSYVKTVERRDIWFSLGIRWYHTGSLLREI